MKRFTTLILSLCAAIAAEAQTGAVLKLRTNDSLTENLATGAKKITISATGTLEWVSGATLDGASLFRAAAGLAIGSDVQAYSANLTTYAGITPSANVQSLLGAADYAAMKTLLSLINVENTALSTWAGTTNLATLGTVTTGTWQASDIALAYIAQGGATDGQVMLWDNTAGTWEPGTISTGLTINTTTTSGASAGDILTSDGTLLQKLTPGAGVAAWLATPSKANLNSAVSDDDPAYVGTANTFSADQTINDGTNNPVLLFQGTDRSGNVTLNNFGNGIRTSGLIEIDSGFLISTASNTTYRHWRLMPDSTTVENCLQLGEDSAGPPDQTFKASDGVGTDIDGADLTLSSGNSAGTGTSAIIFTTPAAGSSGTATRVAAERMRISSSGVAIGTRGSAMSAIATVVKTAFDPGSIAAGATETTTATITGCAAGSTYIPSPIYHAGLVISAARTGTDTVTITLYNPTESSIDAGSIDIRVTEIAF